MRRQSVADVRDPGAEELIADPQVSTVSVCLPHYLHFPVAMAAIRAGLNVLVEKPLAVRLLDRIYRTAAVLRA